MATVFGSGGGGGFNPLVTTSRSTSSGSNIFGGSPSSGSGNLQGSFANFNKVLPAPAMVDMKSLPVFNVPKIQAGMATPAVVSTPADLASRISTIYQPRYQELAREQQLQNRAQDSQMANAGLADSGVAVGARQVQNEQFGRENAALQGSQAGDQLNVEFQTLVQNAANKQSASLANAQMSTQAQTANAQLVLAGQTAKAENYLKALGINAQIADSYRNSFMGFYDAEQQRQIQKDSLLQSFNSSLLDAMLKQAALEEDASTKQQALALEKQKLTPTTYSLDNTGGPNGSYAYKPNYVPAGGSSPLLQTATGSPTLAATRRLFGGVTSLGIGGR